MAFRNLKLVKKMNNTDKMPEEEKINFIKILVNTEKIMMELEQEMQQDNQTIDKIIEEIILLKAQDYKNQKAA